MINIPDSIFPTDDQGQKICPACKKTVDACTCKSFDPNRPKTEQFRPRIRLEKKGRRGKAVTLIEGLPPDEAYLKDLTRRVKAAAASGGTFYIKEGQGTIEVQGNQQAAVRRILDAEDFSH